MVDNSELTTISDLTPLAIYTIRVQAFTSMGAGPMSNPVQVKTQQGKCRINYCCKIYIEILLI
jgi:netrin-G3 ligand